MQIIKQVSDKENSEKYLLEVEDKDVGCGYLFNREVNPIEINIEEKYQSNGYGKILFKSLLDVAKQQGVKGMIFELSEDQYRFINIISQAGAVKVGRDGSVIKYILKIS